MLLVIYPIKKKRKDFRIKWRLNNQQITYDIPTGLLQNPPWFTGCPSSDGLLQHLIRSGNHQKMEGLSIRDSADTERLTRNYGDSTEHGNIIIKYGGFFFNRLNQHMVFPKLADPNSNAGLTNKGFRKLGLAHYPMTQIVPNIGR